MSPARRAPGARTPCSYCTRGAWRPPRQGHRADHVSPRRSWRAAIERQQPQLDRRARAIVLTAGQLGALAQLLAELVTTSRFGFCSCHAQRRGEGACSAVQAPMRAHASNPVSRRPSRCTRSMQSAVCRSSSAAIANPASSDCSALERRIVTSSHGAFGSHRSSGALTARLRRARPRRSRARPRCAAAERPTAGAGRG